MSYTCILILVQVVLGLFYKKNIFFRQVPYQSWISWLFITFLSLIQDTQWVDIDYMDQYRDWTLDPVNFSDLPALVDDLHSYGMHFIPIVVS